MAPSAWRDGGRGETIAWTVAESALGPMLVAATAKGICRLAFVETDPEADLRARFPHAAVAAGGHEMAEMVGLAVAAVASPERPHDLPLDVRGTAFQQRVWAAMRGIAAGTTASYAGIAASIGQPKASRAVAAACAANPLAVAIPCHRVVRSDGSLSGYRWGIERKRSLLEREARA